MRRRRRNYRKKKNGGVARKKAMLESTRQSELKYDLREALATSDLDEGEVNNIIANIISKGTRISYEEAENYIKSLEGEVLPSEIVSKILRSLRRYRKVR